MEYSKPPLSYLDQANLWRSRGLRIDDEARAIKYLSSISYYRLSAYALPFQKLKDKFDSGTTFDDVLNLYLFDRELRLLVFNAIERIEIAVRSAIIYKLSMKYGSHWQDDSSLFCAPRSVINKNGGDNYTVDVYADIQKTIQKTCKEKHPETFIKHYKETYSSPSNPPSWMCLEVFTLGQLSQLYNALQHNEDQKEIATHFALHPTVFRSWLHTLTYVRNICCHHARLWNRDIAIAPTWLQKAQLPWLDDSFKTNTSRTFYAVCIIKYLLQTANPGHNIKQHLLDLFGKYNAPIQYMGIPSLGNNSSSLVNWQNQALWEK